MGDGSTVTCDGPGTPYQAETDPKASSPDCGHTYLRSSARESGQAFVVSATVFGVVLLGTLWGTMLPLMFRRLGMDPALMSNPLIAAFMDMMGVVLYNSIALTLLANVV